MASEDSDDVRHFPISDGEAPSRAAYLAVAEVKGCDPLELPPLARSIDTDSVDLLANGGARTEDLSVSFEYAGCLVTITPEEVSVLVH